LDHDSRRARQFRDDAVTETATHFDLPQMLMTIVNDYADRHWIKRPARATLNTDNSRGSSCSTCGRPSPPLRAREDG
jgi:hypothetical protein